MNTTALIILQWSERALGNQIASASFDTDGGGQFTFDTPLYAATAPDDSTPKHVWCSAQFDDAHWPLVAQFSTQFTNPIIVPYTDPAVPDETLSENGLRRGFSTL